MSTKSYNSLTGSLNVRPTPTVSRSGGSNAVVLIGGYDADNADADVTAGEAVAITDPANADDQLGTCELSRAAAAATANGATDIRAVPVPETETTESISTGQSLSLTNSPIFDPNLHPDHSITVTDTDAATDLTVNITYSDSVTTPSEEDTANVNPLTGQVEVDASGNYDITYTYGEYGDAIDAAADQPVRYLCPLVEDAGQKATTVTELADIANDFDFKRAVTGAKPAIDAGDVGDYTPDEQDWRMVEVAPSRAVGADGPVRTAAAVAGFMASQPIGPDGSTLYDNLNGLTDLNTTYRGTTAKSFEGVTSITRTGKVAQAVTTSTSGQFANVYATEIIDKVSLDLFDVAEDYAGGPQDLGELEALLRSVCASQTEQSPPLLGFAEDTDGRPYDVNVSLGADSGVANASVTIVPTPIAEEVNVNLTVSDGFVAFGGAN